MRSYGGRRPAVRPARPGKREANKSPLSAADDGISTIMAQGGWEDPRSVMRYKHVVPERQAQAVAKLPIGPNAAPGSRKRRRGA